MKKINLSLIMKNSLKNYFDPLLRVFAFLTFLSTFIIINPRIIIVMVLAEQYQTLLPSATIPSVSHLSTLVVKLNNPLF
jgi:hypothetical protein